MRALEFNLPDWANRSRWGADDGRTAMAMVDAFDKDAEMRKKRDDD